MIVVTQLIYVHEGHEDDFLEFESVVLPLLPHHGGELLLRARPHPKAIIAGTSEPPYEIHLVQFPDEAALDRYMNDPTRRAVLHLKDRSVRATVVVKGLRQ